MPRTFDEHIFARFTVVDAHSPSLHTIARHSYHKQLVFLTFFAHPVICKYFCVCLWVTYTMGPSRRLSPKNGAHAKLDADTFSAAPAPRMSSWRVKVLNHVQRDLDAARPSWALSSGYG
jgi:hypothetical protein